MLLEQNDNKQELITFPFICFSLSENELSILYRSTLLIRKTKTNFSDLILWKVISLWHIFVGQLSCSTSPAQKHPEGSCMSDLTAEIEVEVKDQTVGDFDPLLLYMLSKAH